MRYAIVGVLVALLAPTAAMAGGRGDWGHGGGHHRGGGGDRWSVSIGFGSSDYYGSSSSFGFNYSRGYDRGWSRPAPVYAPPVYSRPPICYTPAPVVYQPVYTPPPVVVYQPPVYRYEPYCAPAGGYGYYNSTNYYYGR